MIRKIFFTAVALTLVVLGSLDGNTVVSSSSLTSLSSNVSGANQPSKAGRHANVNDKTSVGTNSTSSYVNNPDEAVIDFENLKDSTPVAGFYPNLIFTRATAINAGRSLNEFEAPPHSGLGAIFDDGGPILISFTSPVTRLGGYFTYSTKVTLVAFDKENQQVASASSATNSNFVLSGEPGSGGNELLSVSYDKGITGVLITGADQGSSFVLDDLTIGTAAGGIKTPVQGRRQPAEVKATPPEFQVIKAGAEEALMAIAFPRANPDLVFTRSSTQVTVTVTIAADPTLLQNSINVIRLNAQGQAATVGRLYDDGTHGDEEAADDIYSGRILFNESTVGDIPLVVSAAQRGNLKRVLSASFLVTVANRPSPEELKKNFETHQTAAQSFEKLRTQFGDQRAVTDTVAYLRQQPNVAAAGVASDGRSIWIKYKNGLEAGISGNPPNTKSGSSVTVDSPPEFMPTEFAAAGNFQTSTSCSCSEAGGLPKVKPVVLAPFFDQFSKLPSKDESDEIAKLLGKTCLETSYGGKVPVLKNTAVTVNTMKNLYQYNVVYISTHGGIVGANKVGIWTREPDTLFSEVTHLVDWIKGRVIPDAIGGVNYWAITPEFVNHYVNGRFKNSLVVLSACHTFGPDGKNLTMANAFRGNGAADYFGWRESVHASFSYDVGIALLTTLTNSKLASSDRTTARAFAGIASKTDPVAPFATFMTAGTGKLVLSVPTTNQCPRVVVSTSFQISPKPGPYFVGQAINATFSVTNRGTGSIVMNKLLAGGRVGAVCSGGACPDFTPRTNVRLDPGQTYNYSGTFTPSAVGHYTFSVAYQKTDGVWVMPVESEKGAVNVLNIVVQNPPPKLTGTSPAAIVAGPTPRVIYLNGTGLSQILYCYLQFPDGRGTYIYIPLAQVTGHSDRQLEIKTKFLTRGTYYIWAFTMDRGRSNSLPIVVN